MNPLAIINQARADGVKLVISAAGSLKAIGEEVTLYRWLPLIREHKIELIAALQGAANENMTDATPIAASHACDDCQHFARPGRAAGYCGGRDDLPHAYGANHPLRRLPDDHGASCEQWQASK